jgi:D-glycerate 3-kinase
MQDNSAYCDNAPHAGHSPGPLYSVFPTTPAQVSSVKDLFDFICQGPLMDKTGLTSEKVAESIDKWLMYGSKLCRVFRLNELYLTEPQKVRIFHYYVPVFLWCEEEISNHISTFKEGEDIPPLVVCNEGLVECRCP